MLQMKNQISDILEQKRVATINGNFMLGEHKINLVPQYKYLDNNQYYKYYTHV